jgi:hypothetical protein
MDYEGAQFLFMGGDYGKLGKTLEGPQEVEKEDKDKETPLEELEKLEEEEEFII